MDGNILQTVTWIVEHGNGEERCNLVRLARGFQMDGTVKTRLDGQEVQISYQITCDTQWRTKTVRAEVQAGEEHRQLSLDADGHGGWWIGETELNLCGCLDVDLEITPATNMLPIRRLRLPIGGSAEIEAVWVRFPSLTVEALRQNYTRLDENHYRYESGNNGFHADIEVDEIGMVVWYGDIWARKEVNAEG